ncbi:hypothetical protein HW555_000509 [Spodoptera exigua]|uniref:Uncharacterized protein n=1 Tax=Spodoptera exigua TaxID=7107 RepID=A0A835GRQ1_SPOEX|nr:hypothetical protein HW555_000509 [Spodoptera exigua]
MKCMYYVGLHRTQNKLFKIIKCRWDDTPPDRSPKKIDKIGIGVSDLFTMCAMAVTTSLKQHIFIYAGINASASLAQNLVYNCLILRVKLRAFFEKGRKSVRVGPQVRAAFAPTLTEMRLRSDQLIKADIIKMNMHLNATSVKFKSLSIIGRVPALPGQKSSSLASLISSPETTVSCAGAQDCVPSTLYLRTRRDAGGTLSLAFCVRTRAAREVLMSTFKINLMDVGFVQKHHNLFPPKKDHRQESCPVTLHFHR